MSFATTNIVWTHSRHHGTELLLLLAIAWHANDQKGGIAWPSVERLAEMVRVSVRHVYRLVHKLETSGELRVLSGQGPYGTNLYQILLPLPNSDASVTGDKPGSTAVTPTSVISDTADTQSVKEPLNESTPIIPKGDAEFWIKVSFECFNQSPHPIHPRLRRRLEQIVTDLDKKYVPCLLAFYRQEPLDTKQAPYTSRKHSPERLMWDLPRQLALAAQTCPPPPPKKQEPPLWREFFQSMYPGCINPRSFFDLDRDLQEEYQRKFSDFQKTINNVDQQSPKSLVTSDDSSAANVPSIAQIEKVTSDKTRQRNDAPDTATNADQAVKNQPNDRSPEKEQTQEPPQWPEVMLWECPVFELPDRFEQLSKEQQELYYRLYPQFVKSARRDQKQHIGSLVAQWNARRLQKT